MHSFPSYLGFIGRLPDNTLAVKQACFSLGGWLWKDMVAVTNWQLSNCGIPWDFKYWLMWLWHTFLTEHEVTRKITEHMQFMSATPWMPVDWTDVLRFLAVSEGFACSNSVISVQYILCRSRYKVLIKTQSSLLYNRFKNMWVTCENSHFHYSENKVNKHEVWCKIINAFRS